MGKGSRGVPRIVDRIAETALILAMEKKSKEIDAELVLDAIDDGQPMSQPGRSARRFRGDFHESRWAGVRVRRSRFEIDGDIHERLKGCLRSTTSIRKVFEEGMPSCRSDDGKRSSEGRMCADCGHPRCRPQLRVQREQEHQVLILDLPHSSARNLIRLVDELGRKDKCLAAIQLVLRVVDQGYWGEVRFEIA